MKNSTVHYRNVQVNGLNIFYRESGPKDAPTILLLHGYPTSSHMFRGLIALLNEHYHIVAPDLPGFGYSDAPDHEVFHYTFDNLAKTIQDFINRLQLTRFAMYVFDYGAPVGWRLAVANPGKIAAIITQNGNAYLEGLSDGWGPIKAYWKDPSEENRNALKRMTTLETTKWQYLHGVGDESRVAPESYTLDQHFLDRPGNVDIQLDLLKDYANNIARYPDFQAYFRAKQPPLLAVWGDQDPFFLPPGAGAFKRDIPGAVVKFFPTGHFALETHAREIGAEIEAFLSKISW